MTTSVLMGGLAGLAATAVMTAAMSRLHQRLPEAERYPLPPREIVERIMGPHPEEGARDDALVAHFSFGALAGGLLGLLFRQERVRSGGLYGVAVWAASYFGWAPLFGLLKPAFAHPLRRNALMAFAHLLWGSTTMAALKELLRARQFGFAGGPFKDAYRSSKIIPDTANLLVVTTLPGDARSSLP